MARLTRCQNNVVGWGVMPCAIGMVLQHFGSIGSPCHKKTEYTTYTQCLVVMGQKTCWNRRKTLPMPAWKIRLKGEIKFGDSAVAYHSAGRLANVLYDFSPSQSWLQTQYLSSDATQHCTGTKFCPKVSHARDDLFKTGATCVYLWTSMITEEKLVVLSVDVTQHHT